jgi:hypothetical protein
VTHLELVISAILYWQGRKFFWGEDLQWFDGGVGRQVGQTSYTT